MIEASGDSVEFYPVEDDEQLLQFSRAYFRVRVADKNGFTIKINNLKSPLADISIGGVSLLADPAAVIRLGDVIEDCEICMDGDLFSGLCGRIVHHSLDASGRTVTGIQWLDVDPLTVKRFKTCLTRLRRRVFKRI
jgi:c-di-GMP-binding flagellar brake protein YcgR